MRTVQFSINLSADKLIHVSVHGLCSLIQSPRKPSFVITRVTSAGKACKQAILAQLPLVGASARSEIGAVWSGCPVGLVETHWPGLLWSGLNGETCFAQCSFLSTPSILRRTDMTLRQTDLAARRHINSIHAPSPSGASESRTPAAGHKFV